MPLMLGMDTGGTYTDAVLYDEDRGVVATAKAPTTRPDPGEGLGAAMEAVLGAAACDPGEIGLVSLSTTLATNALVEGQGGRVGLVLIGFPAGALARGGLGDALGDDPWLAVAGGHDARGQAAAALDLDALDAGLDAMAGQVAAVAVAGMFAVRNPEHEVAARERVRARTGLPVTCSHELSSQLDGPRRAMTSVLNARLIGLIDRLITGARVRLSRAGIEARLMMVRGDGALISAELAALRPIETILSGPAASIVGAAHLTGLDEAVVADIGGTTTDIAVLEGGRPRLHPVGATVGGHRTMVEAVDMRTVGLGGDSEIRVGVAGLSPAIAIGPRRVVPLCAFAAAQPALVHEALDRQLAGRGPGDLYGRFAFALAGEGAAPAALSQTERHVLDTLAGAPLPLDRLITVRAQLGALARLRARGLVGESAVTPTDAAHVLGLHALWETDAASKGLALLARHKDGRGQPAAPDGPALARRIVDTLIERSAEAVLDAALARDGHEQPELARYLLARQGRGDDLAGRPHGGGPAAGASLVSTRVALERPLVALGASAATYYPPVADRLRTRCEVPPHAGVANAVGAVVGQVRGAAHATLGETADGRFTLFLESGPRVFDDAARARDCAQERLEALARERAHAAGAAEVTVRFESEEKRAQVEGRDILVEATLIATASGRPRFAR